MFSSLSGELWLTALSVDKNIESYQGNISESTSYHPETQVTHV